MIELLKHVLNSRYTVWLLLFVPSVPLIADFHYHDRYYAEIMYESGLLATQLTVIALAITPLLRVSAGIQGIQICLFWLQQRRRAIGVAAFGYAALHTLFYLRETGGLDLVILELEEPSLTTGWLGMFVLLVLAATSNSFSVRRLGPKWKTLQRASYLAAIAIFLHWWLIDQFLQQLLIWFLPLIILQVMRVIRTRHSIKK